MSSAQALSFIAPEEEADARAFIQEHLGFEAPRPCGYHIAVKLYIRGDDVKKFVDDAGNEMLIEVPDVVAVEDRYRSCTALVLAVGPDSYKGKRFEESGPWCKVGDWVVIPRNEGTQLNYRGTIIQVLPDDRVLMTVEDPSHVTKEY